MSCFFMSCIFMYCNFMPYDLIHQFHVLQWHVLRFGPLFSCLTFSVYCSFWSVNFRSFIFSQPDIAEIAAARLTANTATMRTTWDTWALWEQFVLLLKLTNDVSRRVASSSRVIYAISGNPHHPIMMMMTTTSLLRSTGGNMGCVRYLPLGNSIIEELS